MSKVVHEKMSGGQWVAALRKDSTLASKCEWEKLSGADWRRLLKECPQFADKCDWSLLSVDDWRRLLVDQPQFCEYCDFEQMEAEGLLDGLLLCRPELANKCDVSGWDAKRWMEILNLCPNNDELVNQCDKWSEFPIDCVCGMLCAHPKLIESCPDSVFQKFRLGHWAKLSHWAKLNNISRVVVEKMEKINVVTDATDDKEQAVIIGGFRWCCPYHWAEAYGSLFLKMPLRASAVAVCDEMVSHEQKVDQQVKFIAENSAMNPKGGFPGSCFSSNISRHIQWLAALAADFAAMAAEAAVSAPKYTEEYSIISQAAAYETSVLMSK